MGTVLIFMATSEGAITNSKREYHSYARNEFIIQT